MASHKQAIVRLGTSEIAVYYRIVENGERDQKAAAALRQWVEQLPGDAEALFMAVCDENAAQDLREHAAAALNYLLTKMDLVPDWTESIGAVDDAMVVRACIANAGDVGIPDGARYADHLQRLIYSAEELDSHLGGELAALLTKFCLTLRELEVRGRTPEMITESEKLQKQLWTEVQDTMVRVAAPVFQNPGRDIATLRSFLTSKLREKNR